MTRFSSLRVVLGLILWTDLSTTAFQNPIFQVATTIQGRSPTRPLWAEEPSDKDAEEPPAEEPAAPPAADVNDIVNSPEFLKRKIEVLKSEIASAEESIAEAKQRLEAGKAEWEPQIEKLKTEYQNMQNRMNTESNKSDEQATSIVVRKMLDVLDNFDRGFAAVQPANEEQEAITGQYREVYENMLETFKSLGVVEVDTVGKEFDYEVHQAVMQRPDPDHEEGIVCQELSKGFKVGNVLIRAAMVVVAA